MKMGEEPKTLGGFCTNATWRKQQWTFYKKASKKHQLVTLRLGAGGAPELQAPFALGEIYGKKVQVS